MQFLGLFLDALEMGHFLIGAGIVLLAVLVAISWAIARSLKPRLGWGAYVVAGLFFLLPACFLILFGWGPAPKPSSGPPKVVSSPKLSRFVRGGDHPSIDGLAFFDGELYVGTSVGLVEVQDGKVSKLLQFQNSDSSASGPWLDPANHLLWAYDDPAHEFLRFDGTEWTRTPDPAAAGSCMSAAEFGGRLLGDAQGFWLASSGCAWQWDPSFGRWQTFATVPHVTDSRSPAAYVVGVLPIAPTPLLIVGQDPLRTVLLSGRALVSDEITGGAAVNAPAIERKSDPFLAGTWAVTADAAYVCRRIKPWCR